MELLTGIFSAFGLSASAGLNAYIPLLVIGVIDHYTDLITLQKPWDTLSNPWILILLGILLIIEMLADKIPAVNHINDAIQTVVRPVAGAIAFAASANVITDVNPVLALALGLFVAGGVHAAKAGVARPVVTATTGGAANVPVSVAEDVTATGVSILAILVPMVVGVLLIVAVSFIIWWLWRKSTKAPTNP
ncbi:MAG: DUF4126 domain-containing protein [Anaerolineaceae bacterium]|nr:MAG: DUF4126 domain-containing protein [Anaerolineaceae bacterium]